MECNDIKCPVHGKLKTHGYEFNGVVVSDRAAKTAIVEREYTTFLQKYERSLRKTSRIPAHNPDCIKAKQGDFVTIANTRRISKTKSFVITRVLKGVGQ